MRTLTTSIGGPDSATRDELRRLQRERFAMQSGCEELKRSDLTFTGFAITHTNGDSFKVYNGEISAGPTHPTSAFYYDPDGNVVFLERLPRR